jgi:NAD(P)-dependent dehydrogenase (short-subunit alcohol dehydrogenase family)
MPTAIITGSAGGIGQALVRTFANAGYQVIATDWTKKPTDLACDYYRMIDLARLVEEEDYATIALADLRVVLAGQGLDVLINNAAVQILGGVEMLTRGDWRRSLDVNLIAPFLLTQALLHDLEQARGCVINISSIHARLTKKNFIAYATTKAALSGMTRAMAVDLGPRVRVNAIEPAAIETPMLRAGFANKPKLYGALEASHPQQRIGSAEEVSHLALNLVSADTAFLHGTCVAFDGGISARLFDPD